MKTYKIAFFRFRCEACRKPFDGPLLPDMESYGYFLVSRTGGRFGIVQTIAHAGNEKAWDRIEKLCGRMMKDEKTKKAWAQTRRLGGDRVCGEAEDDDILQRVYCACLDPHDGDIWEHGFLCPACGSRDIAYGDANMRGTKEIEMLEFKAFNALGPRAQKAHAEKALLEIRKRLRKNKVPS